MVSGRGAETILKLGGGGGQTSPGVQGKPYPKLENSPDLAHYCELGETQVHVQKQTKTKINYIENPKLGGAPQPPICGGKLPPLPPPPPRLPRPWFLVEPEQEQEQEDRTHQSADVGGEGRGILSEGGFAVSGFCD